MQHSEQINELAAALAKAQGALKPAAKDTENPHFKSRYADLASIMDVCRKPLSDNGLAVMQGDGDKPDAGGAFTVETLLVHTSGQWVRSTLSAVPRDRSPQSIGSACSYLRRYSLASLIGIVADADDDGNAAQPAAGTSRESNPIGAALREKPAPSDADLVVAIKRFGALMQSIETREQQAALYAEIRRQHKDTQAAVMEAHSDLWAQKKSDTGWTPPTGKQSQPAHAPTDGAPESDPVVKFSPKRWEGDDYKGAKFSDCEPAFLDAYAEALEYSAANPKPGKEKYADFDRRDAAAAREWADHRRNVGVAA